MQAFDLARLIYEACGFGAAFFLGVHFGRMADHSKVEESEDVEKQSGD